MGRDKRRIFRMKQFEVSHSRSSNKVGVDGVLIGAWAPVPVNCLKVLDVGCGCGIITLMLAQRIPDADILGIDIDPEAVEEAAANALRSPWSERVEIREMDINEYRLEGRTRCIASLQSSEKVGVNDWMDDFDLIVSNPPFFDAGVESDISSRMLARHVGSLSPEILVRVAPRLLSEDGMLALVTVADDYERLSEVAEECGMYLSEAMFVRGNPNKPPKRVMMAFRKGGEGRESEKAPGLLTIEDAPGQYSEEYRRLSADFYLKF